jgi:hypothetical protein
MATPAARKSAPLFKKVSDSVQVSGNGLGQEFSRRTCMSGELNPTNEGVIHEL